MERMTFINNCSPPVLKIIILNQGTEQNLIKASYNKKPEAIYFGKLDGYWINLPLLSKLSKIYPIDVYGSPELKWKNTLKALDIILDSSFVSR
jgi:hypothetical protein